MGDRHVFDLPIVRCCHLCSLVVCFVIFVKFFFSIIFKKWSPNEIEQGLEQHERGQVVVVSVVSVAVGVVAVVVVVVGVVVVGGYVDDELLQRLRHLPMILRGPIPRHCLSYQVLQYSLGQRSSQFHHQCVGGGRHCFQMEPRIGCVIDEEPLLLGLSSQQKFLQVVDRKTDPPSHPTAHFSGSSLGDTKSLVPETSR